MLKKKGNQQSCLPIAVQVLPFTTVILAAYFLQPQAFPFASAGFAI